MASVSGPNERYPHTPNPMYSDVTTTMATRKMVLKLPRSSLLTEPSSERISPAPS